MEKRVFRFFLIICLVFSTLTTIAFAADEGEANVFSLPFTDVSTNAWYYPYVQTVYERDMMQGTSMSAFSPHGSFSRAQIVATLFRVHTGRHANESDSRINSFQDVNSAAWYAPYVAWADRNGVSHGVEAFRFGSNDSVSRQEIATIFHRYVRNLTMYSSSSPDTEQWRVFTDHEEITNGEGVSALRWANNNGIINGTSATKLLPQGTATRAEAAAMLLRLLDFMDRAELRPPMPNEINIQPLLWANFNDFRNLLGSVEEAHHDRDYFPDLWDFEYGLYIFDTGIVVQTIDGIVDWVLVLYGSEQSRERVHFDGINGNSSRADIRNALGVPDVNRAYDPELSLLASYGYFLPNAILSFNFDSNNRLMSIYYQQWGSVGGVG